MRHSRFYIDIWSRWFPTRINVPIKTKEWKAPEKPLKFRWHFIEFNIQRIYFFACKIALLLWKRNSLNIFLQMERENGSNSKYFLLFHFQVRNIESGSSLTINFQLIGKTFPLCQPRFDEKERATILCHDSFFCSDQPENIVSKAPLSFMKNSSDSSVKSYVFGLPLIVRVTLKLGEIRNETKKTTITFKLKNDRLTCLTTAVYRYLDRVGCFDTDSF